MRERERERLERVLCVSNTERQTEREGGRERERRVGVFVRLYAR